MPRRAVADPLMIIQPGGVDEVCTVAALICPEMRLAILGRHNCNAASTEAFSAGCALIAAARVSASTICSRYASSTAKPALSCVSHRVSTMRKTVLAALSLVAACTSPSRVPALRPHEIAIGPYHQRAEQSLVGSLMYEGGCLMFNGENGSPQLVPIWPSGTRFEEKLVTFHQPGKDDQHVAIGQEIRLDGVPSEWSQFELPRFRSFQSQCGAKPFFVSGLAPAN